MDAIDILGDLLGQKKNQPGRGTDILKDIFGRGSESSSGSTQPKPNDISRQAQELEKILNVANNRSSGRQSAPSQTNSRSAPLPADARQSIPLPRQKSASRSPDAGAAQNRNSENERAVILIRAMVNAAKADGQIDLKEQNRMIDNLGNRSPENLEFLRQEFSQPLDIQEFVRSVPFGMEQQVYMMSLIAIDLDQRSEAGYLAQLADGLRIPLDVREQIHQRCGVPGIR